jgi:phage gp46-like protein
MATDQRIDPSTRDYIDLPNGDWEEVDDSSTAVMIQLDADEGAWWGDPLSGSQIGALMRYTQGEGITTAETIRDAARRALNALAAVGMISDVATTIIEERTGFAGILLQWFDHASNRPVDLAYSPLGGFPR